MKYSQGLITKSAFPAFGAPMSSALVHGSLWVEGLALPKSVDSGDFSLNDFVIRCMSDNLRP
jgi:hypothetical protein